MHNDLKSGAATQADTRAIARIAEATGLFPAAMLGDMIAGYLDRTGPDIWLTATLAGEPVAFCFCEPERITEGTWNLLAIGAMPDRQSQGVGAELVRHLKATPRDGCNRVLLVETTDAPEFVRTRRST